MAILANELRIGNWVEWVYPNRNNQPNKFQFCQIESTRTSLVGVLGSAYGYDQIQPIPLTPEILEKCGFEKKQWTTKGIEITCYYYQLNNIVVYPLKGFLKGFFEIELITEAGQFNMYKSWNYLHQLQNLYFALTNSELTFKP